MFRSNTCSKRRTAKPIVARPCRMGRSKPAVAAVSGSICNCGHENNNFKVIPLLIGSIYHGGLDSGGLKHVLWSVEEQSVVHHISSQQFIKSNTDTGSRS